MRLSDFGTLLLALILLGLSTPSLAASYTVTNTNDSGAGSLRAAIETANSTADNDTITFNVSANGTINLQSTLTIANNGTLTITGNGATNTALSGQDNVQILNIYIGAHLTLEDVTITQGRTTYSYGGGVYNQGTLTLSNSTFSGNFASASGGGIANIEGTLTVSNSTFSGNSANYGGGIANIAGTLTISNTTFSDNSATHYGGGIHNDNDGTMTASNSTFSSNSANLYGGGIINNGVMTLSNSTFSGNSASTSGGGIFNSGTLTLDNSVIANSISGGDCFNVVGTTNAQHSLIEDNLTCVNGTNSNNLTGDPLLNLDLTLQASSPAINTGNNSLIPSGVTTDLTGHPRIQNGTVDMGAYEFTPTISLSLLSPNVTEGGSTNLTLTRDGSTASALTVNVDITLGTGTTTSDYTLSGASISAQSGGATVTIPAGFASVTLSLAASEDALDESDETLTLALVDTANYDLDSSNKSTTATIADNDTAGITVTPTSGLTTTEASSTATFTVKLNSQPTADVVIAISSNDTTEGTVSPANLTFTNANWNTPQTVTVTGVDDAVVDGTIAYSIVLAAATSSDANYNGVNPTDVSVSNSDNDAVGITVTPTSGLTTTEASATATFTVALNSQPTADVVIALSSNDTSEGTVSPSSLTFTNANWNSAQTVTVTGIDDALVDGSIGYSITLAAATSSDANYNGVNPTDVSVSNSDDDTAGITVTPTSGLTTTEAGGTATFTVKLNSQPTADVVINLSSNDTSEGTVSPSSLTFTSANWNTAQTVTVTGVDDALVDGTIGYSITLAAATSSDANYSGVNPTDVSVTNTDDDTAASIPTLSEWALLLLAMLMLGLGMHTVTSRRR